MSESAKKVLCEYLDSVLEDNMDNLSSICDFPFTVITLYESITVAGESELIKMFKQATDSFRNQGLSVSYEKEKFEVLNIQANVKLIRAVLVKHDAKKEIIGTWNCTYLLIMKDHKWVVFVAASDKE